MPTKLTLHLFFLFGVKFQGMFQTFDWGMIEGSEAEHSSFTYYKDTVTIASLSF